MKQYIISEQLLDAIMELPMSNWLYSKIEDLKLVEPLTDRQMMEKFDITSVTPLIRKIVRMVELAHGVGERP